MNRDNQLNTSVPSPINDRNFLVSGKIIWISVAAIAIAMIGLFAFVIWLAFAYPDRIEAMRDVFIMLFALVSCSAVIVMVMMLVAIIRLINMIDYELRPILEKTNETVGLVKGTTHFVSKNVVQPAIRTTSFIAGVNRGLRTLFGRRSRNLPD
ncbi:MAG: hypothetical protein ACI9EW_001606 [Cellvibrionaceae bacterium]|jgi:hypothetical protein